MTRRRNGPVAPKGRCHENFEVRTSGMEQLRDEVGSACGRATAK